MHSTLDVLAPQLVYPTLDELTDLLPDTSETHRFLAKVKVGPVPAHNPALGPCLLWKNALDGSGYSTFKGGNSLPGGARQLSGHMWLHLQLNRRPVPAGYELDHICHVPELCTVPGKKCPHRPCVLHTKVELVSVNRTRANSNAGRNAVKEWCEGEYGPHDLRIPSNVYIAPKTGERKCVPCQSERFAAWSRKAKRLKAEAKHRGLQDAGHLTLIG